MPGLVGEVLDPAQQRFPLVPRQAAILEIRSRPLASMIEEADIVVGFLDRLDLTGDELIKLGEISHQISRQ